MNRSGPPVADRMALDDLHKLAIVLRGAQGSSWHGMLVGLDTLTRSGGA